MPPMIIEVNHDRVKMFYVWKNPLGSCVCVQEVYVPKTQKVKQNETLCVSDQHMVISFSINRRPHSIPFL